MTEKVNDLRSALALLKNMPGQLIETDVEVEPEAELSGVYRHVGAWGTVQRPTKEGPAMIFQNVKGHPGARVAIGVLASRKRVAALLGTKPENLGKMLYESVDHPVAPVLSKSLPLVRKSFIKWRIRILICTVWFRRRPIRRTTQGRILLWECAMPPIRTRDSAMLLYTGCASRERTNCLFSLRREQDISGQWRNGQKNWDRNCRFPSASEWTRPLRSDPALSRRQLLLDMMSWRLQELSGENRWNYVTALR